MTQHQGYIRTRSGRTPKAPIQSGHQGDVSMGKSGGTKSSSRNATNNGEGADVDAQNNKLGGSSRLAKHDPLQTYSQNLTSKELREVRDIDALDKQNPLAVTEFVNDMFNYWFRVEPLTRVSCNYMRSQTDINHKMRAILVDWLVEVHLKFKLMPETLFLTHNLIDRFLEKKAVSLIAAACRTGVRQSSVRPSLAVTSSWLSTFPANGDESAVHCPRGV